MKHLDSILKNYAAGIELCTVAIASNLFFDVPLTFGTIIGIFLIILASWIYAKAPVSKEPQNPKEIDEKEILQKEILEKDEEKQPLV